VECPQAAVEAAAQLQANLLHSNSRELIGSKETEVSKWAPACSARWGSFVRTILYRKDFDLLHHQSCSRKPKKVRSELKNSSIPNEFSSVAKIRRR
jgi:hypothetical protein